MTLSENEIFNVVSTFDERNDAKVVGQLMALLRRRFGYKLPGRLVQQAINEGIFYVDSIDSKSGEVIVALDELGEEYWEDL